MADRDGGVTAGPPVRLGGRRAGDPVRTGWDGFDEAQPVVLDDLADVDAPRPPQVSPPCALVRGEDGIYRAIPLEQVVATYQRGDVTFYVDDDPAAPPSEVRAGEHVVVLAGPTAGTVYEVLED